MRNTKKTKKYGASIEKAYRLNIRMRLNTTFPKIFGMPFRDLTFAGALL